MQIWIVFYKKTTVIIKIVVFKYIRYSFCIFAAVPQGLETNIKTVPIRTLYNRVKLKPLLSLWWKLFF